MNRGLDFVYLEIPFETAEQEWCDFLTRRKALPSLHRVVFISALAGSFLVSNERRPGGIVPGLRRRAVPTAQLLRDFQDRCNLLLPAGRSLRSRD